LRMLRDHMQRLPRGAVRPAKKYRRRERPLRHLETGEIAHVHTVNRGKHLA